MTPPEINGELGLSRDDLWVGVLNYPFEHTRELIDKLHFPADFFSDVSVETATELLLERGFNPASGLFIPRTHEGRVNLEEIHEHPIEEIGKIYESRLTGLAEFNNRYPTDGSQIAIRLVINEWAQTGKMTSMVTLEQDYHDYANFAEESGIPVYTVASLADVGQPAKGRVTFVSVPSHRDGNWPDLEVLQKFIDDGHDIALDYAFGGLATTPHRLDVRADNVKIIFTSPSKIYGVFPYRLMGIQFSREPVDSMEDRRFWFRDGPGIFLTHMLYDTFGLDELPQIYRDKQRKACEAIAALIDHQVDPSDTLLMATNNDVKIPGYGRQFVLKTNDVPTGHRFRLPRVMELLDRQEATA